MWAKVAQPSFDAQKLQENIEAFLAHIQHLKPNSVKGIYVKSVSISGTMSPGVLVAA